MRETRRKDLGAIAVLGSIVLLVVGAFMALALNVGLMMTARGQLQNASDSAALAAAGSLDGTQNGLFRAQTMAHQFAMSHRVASDVVQIDYVRDVEFGRWHFKAEAGFPARFFEPLLDPFNHPLLVDAVRVTDGCDGTSNRNDPLTVFFGYWLGKNQVNVGSNAVAVGRGARSDDCPLPFVLPACSLWDGSGFKCDQDVTLILKPDGDDNVGFVYMLPDLPGNGPPQAYQNIIQRCSVNATAGVDYSVQNGNDLNDTVIQGLLGAEMQGNHLTPIPPLRADGSSNLCVFDPGYTSFPIGDTTCPDPKFSGEVTVAQYAEVAIKSATDNNGHIYDVTSCPKAPVKWQTYQDSLKHDPTPGRKLVVNVKCGVGNGLGSNTAVTLRLVH